MSKRILPGIKQFNLDGKNAIIIRKRPSVCTFNGNAHRGDTNQAICRHDNAEQLNNRITGGFKLGF